MKTTGERVPSFARRLALLITVAFGVAVGRAEAAELMVNGNLESFTGGMPTGWTYFQGGDGPASLASGVHSPFQNVYAGSTSSVLLTDGNSDVPFPDLFQNVTPTMGVVRFSMEFMMGSLTGKPWELELSSSTTFNMCDVWFDNAGQVTVFDGSNSLVTHGLTPGVWYQISMDFNYNTRTYGGYIQPFGDAAMTFDNRSFFGEPSIGFPENFGRVLFTDGIGFATDVGGPLYLDNFSAMPIPEPAMLSLCGVALLGAAMLRRC